MPSSSSNSLINYKYKADPWINDIGNQLIKCMAYSNPWICGIIQTHGAKLGSNHQKEEIELLKAIKLTQLSNREEGISNGNGNCSYLSIKIDELSKKWQSYPFYLIREIES